jgi:type VI secretion system secreted protein Hcp
LTVRKQGQKPVEYLVITLKDLTISGLTSGTSTDSDLIAETVSLNFAKFEVVYKSQKANGDPDKTVTATWDIAANAES